MKTHVYPCPFPDTPGSCSSRFCTGALGIVASARKWPGLGSARRSQHAPTRADGARRAMAAPTSMAGARFGGGC